MIKHGVLSAHGIYDSLMREMDRLGKSRPVITWDETDVYDDCNRGRSKRNDWRKKWR